GVAAMSALWALYQMGELDDATTMTAFDHSYPMVRLWAVQFLGNKYGVNRGVGLPGIGAGDAEDLPADLMKSLLELTRAESDAEVRAQISSTARRLATPQALALVSILVNYEEDIDDPYIPLLNWWVLEAHIRADREAVL